MAGNPKGSKWRSTPRRKRHRPGIELTLSEPAVEALDEAAGDGASRSAIVETLVLESDLHEIAERIRFNRPGAK